MERACRAHRGGYGLHRILELTLQRSFALRQKDAFLFLQIPERHYRPQSQGNQGIIKAEGHYSGDPNGLQPVTQIFPSTEAISPIIQTAYPPPIPAARSFPVCRSSPFL